MKLFLDQLRSKGRGALALAVTVGAIGFTGTALAIPCGSADPANCIPSGNDFSIKFVDRETQITTLGQELHGIFIITQINNGDGTVPFFGNGDSGRSLVGTFDGLIAIADQTGGGGLSFTGGKVSVFNIPFGTYNPTFGAPSICTVACPAPWLTADFVPGINDAIGGNATLQAALATTNVQAGFGYLSVTGGLHAGQFDTNGFSFTNFPNADMFFRSNFVLATPQTCAANNGWAVCSDDPIIGRTIPEPATVGLLGMVALAAGAIRRKKAA